MTEHYDNGNITVAITDNNITDEDRLNCKIVYSDKDNSQNDWELEFSSINVHGKIGGNPSIDGNIDGKDIEVSIDGKGIEANINKLRFFIRDLALQNYYDENTTKPDKLLQPDLNILLQDLGYNDPLYDTADTTDIRNNPQDNPHYQQINLTPVLNLYSKPFLPLEIRIYELFTRLERVLRDSEKKKSGYVKR